MHSKPAIRHEERIDDDKVPFARRNQQSLRFPEEKGCDRVSNDLPVDFLIDFCGCNFFIKQWMLQRILVL
jgi:hypothetical protein